MFKVGISMLAMSASMAAISVAHAQTSYEVGPSLPVPTPPEERAEMDTPEFYSVAANGVKPKPFNARSKAAEVGARKSIAVSASELRSLPPESRGYVVKAGAFRSFENAQRLHAQLLAIGSAEITHREANGLDYYGVYLGPWKTKAEAQKAYDLALKAGMQDGEIIAPE